MIRVLLSLLLALAVAWGALAQTTTNPAGASSTAPVASPAAPANAYSATVPVAGTSDAQRDAAMSAALAQVLQQVSPGFAAAPEVLAQASGYVRDFHYRRAASSGLELQVDFDPGAIGRVTAQDRAAVGSMATGQPGAAASAGAPTAAGGTGMLWVEGINSSHAFAAMLALLRNDPDLSNVTPVAAEGDGVLLQLGFDQPLATVLAALAGPSGHLVPAAQPHPGADATLRWTP